MALVTSRARGFPFGLYATLLVAAVALHFRDAAGAIEQRLTGILCLPLRAYARLTSDVHAGSSDWAAERRWLAEARARQDRAAAAVSAALRPAGHEPIVCRVREAVRARSSRVPTRLVLERQAAELTGCAEFVTFGDQLLGFLDLRDPAAPAEVALLHAVPETGGPTRLTAEIVLDTAAGPTESLVCLVEPAGAIDPWLLRCVLPADPYRTAQIESGGQPVRTLTLPGVSTPAPPGFGLGEVRVRGYQTMGQTVPIGLYVRPRIAPPAISAVVLWRAHAAAPALSAAAPSIVAQPARLLELPAPPPARERWFVSLLAAAEAVPGAALVSGPFCLGTVQGAGTGYAIVAPFGEPRDWLLLHVPADPAAPPRDLAARTLGRADGLVELVLADREEAVPRDGVLLTGSGGPACPSGYWLGTIADADPAHGRFRVRVPASPGSMRLELLAPRHRSAP